MPHGAANPPWVCRTALGIPVVPELNTNSASASGAGASNGRRPGVTGSSSAHRHQPGEHRVIADGVRRAWSPQGRARLRSPPRRAEQDRRGAKPPDGPQGDTNSGRFDDISATRSPRTPRCSSVSPCRWPGRRARERVFALVEGEGGRLAHVSSPALPAVAEPVENTLSYSENSILVEAESQWHKETWMTVEGTVTILLDRQKASVPARRERDPAGERRRAGLSPPFSCEAGAQRHGPAD